MTEKFAIPRSKDLVRILDIRSHARSRFVKKIHLGESSNPLARAEPVAGTIRISSLKGGCPLLGLWIVTMRMLTAPRPLRPQNSW